MNGYTTFDSDETKAIAMRHARGCYQRRLLEGNEAWSGAGLGKWGSRNRTSREGLLKRLRADKRLLVVQRYAPRTRKRTLEIYRLQSASKEPLDNVDAEELASYEAIAW